MNKELKKYVTDELLLIANNVTGEYTDKQVQQAKLELYNSRHHGGERGSLHAKTGCCRTCRTGTHGQA